MREVLKDKLLITGLLSLLLVTIVLTGISAHPKDSVAGDMNTFSSYGDMEKYIEKQQQLARFLGFGYGRAILTGEPVKADLALRKQHPKTARDRIIPVQIFRSKVWMKQI
ncbi:hypothetical protein N752_23775 [Desulforamulus aquiferis]|nr:hypothetical protein [Desulforamulus aquiferis]RYD02677.1 hypothetical protein N752_23775 [Desulforamulus aquiferis]